MLVIVGARSACLKIAASAVSQYLQAAPVIFSAEATWLRVLGIVDTGEVVAVFGGVGPEMNGTSLRRVATPSRMIATSQSPLPNIVPCRVAVDSAVERHVRAGRIKLLLRELAIAAEEGPPSVA